MANLKEKISKGYIHLKVLSPTEGGTDVYRVHSVPYDILKLR
jgi:hypothetical protein